MKNKLSNKLLGKKLLALILSLSLLFSVIPSTPVFAANEVYGILANNGTIYDCDMDGKNQGATEIAPENVTNLFIADDVERIFNPDMMTKFTNLVSLTIPPTLRVIEAFFGKSPKLENIDFSNATGLEEINGIAFTDCSSLKTVDLSKATNLKAFKQSLSTVTSAFGNCYNLETVILPKNLKELGVGTFAMCSKLADVTFLSKTPPTTGEFTFNKTKDQINFHLPTGSNVNEWEAAFSNTGASNPVFIADNKYGIYKNDGNVYECDENAVATATVADKKALTHIFIAEDVTEIKYAAFFECDQLLTVDFTNAKNLKIIGMSSFARCSALETLTPFPQSMTEIGSYAFSECASLLSMNFPTMQPPTFGTLPFRSTTSGINVTLNSGVDENVWRSALTTAGMTNPNFIIDITPPTAQITVGDAIFTTATSPVIFDTLIKDKAEITITANDTDSGISKIEYQEVETEAEYDVDGIWKPYTDKFEVSYFGTNIIYARVTDVAGNQTIINTNGFIVYADSSLQTEGTEFDRKEENQRDIFVKVNLNGNTLKNITNGETVLKSGTDYIIEDMPLAKNSADYPESSSLILRIQKSYLAKLPSGIQTLNFNLNPCGIEGDLVINTPLEITIKDTGHVHEYVTEFTIDKVSTCTVKGEKSRHCKGFALCGGKAEITEIELVPHTGGVANCHAKAICSVCNNGYGEIDSNNHDGGTELRNIKTATHKEDGYSGDTCCIGCNAVFKLGEVVPKIPHTHDGEWKNDEKSHWLTCAGCNENYDIAPHTFATEASTLASCKSESELVIMKVIIADLKEEYDKNNDTKFQNPIYYFCTGCYRVKKEEYKFSEKIHDVTTGDNLVYEFGTIEGATFTSVAIIKDFLAVSIDNKQLKIEDIKLKSGSTIVTISSAYMDTLPNGKHTVSIYSTTGTATANFTVVGNKETPTTPEKPINPQTPTTPQTPNTGDNGNMPLWISLLFISGGALTIFGISKKRRKVNGK